MTKLTMTENRNGDKLTIIAEGRIDTSNATDFENGIKASIDNVTDLVINMENVNYISSSGLRALLSFHKILTGKGGNLTIYKPTDMVMEVFEVTGFSGVLNIVR